jgi:hypothetical protein
VLKDAKLRGRWWTNWLGAKRFFIGKKEKNKITQDNRVDLRRN